MKWNENDEAPEKGWLVRFTVNGHPYSGFFADEDYGGKDQSLAALREMRGKVVAG